MLEQVLPIGYEYMRGYFTPRLIDDVVFHVPKYVSYVPARHQGTVVIKKPAWAVRSGRGGPVKKFTIDGHESLDIVGKFQAACSYRDTFMPLQDEIPTHRCSVERIDKLILTDEVGICVVEKCYLRVSYNRVDFHYIRFEGDIGGVDYLAKLQTAVKFRQRKMKEWIHMRVEENIELANALAM